jgi:hypothetical protein
VSTNGSKPTHPSLLHHGQVSNCLLILHGGVRTCRVSRRILSHGRLWPRSLAPPLQYEERPAPGETSQHHHTPNKKNMGMESMSIH